MITSVATIIAHHNYPMQLLEAAHEMIKRQQHEVAVVTSQMACEICAERVFRAYFKAKNVEYLEDSVEDLMPSYNLANDKVRRLYTVLTDDPIHQMHFWAEYKIMVSIRNKAIHAGTRIQDNQSELVLRVAKLLIKHLQSVESRAWKQ
jgi:hypothetical protein